MSEKPFASSAYLGGKAEALEVLADGVYALSPPRVTPNVGTVEGEGLLVCFGRALQLPDPP
jgi:hypothetical protein